MLVSTHVAFRIRVLYFIQLPEISVRICCTVIVLQLPNDIVCVFDFQNAFDILCLVLLFFIVL